MSWSLLSATDLAVATGALWCLVTVGHYLSLLWVFVKPSGIRRYLKTRDGKPAWALITGGSGGIGKQVAHELATIGFNVVLHGRSQQKLDVVKADLARSHPNRQFRTIIIDASEAFDAGATCGSWLASLQDINLTVLINNAGGATDATIASLEQLKTEKLITDISVNSVFPTLLIRQAIPLLNQNPAGLILNIGSLADLGIPLGGSYPAAKAYLSKLTEMLSREARLAGHNIEVLCVKVGQVWGTGQTVTEAQDFFSPDASTMAKAMIARVGGGRSIVVGHWKHMLQFEVMRLFPSFLLDSMLIRIVTGWDMAKENKKTKGE